MRYWLAALLLTGFLKAGTATLYVDDLVKMAIEHSPDIDSSRLDFKAAQQRAKGAEGFYLPSVNLSGTGGKQRMKFTQQSAENINLLSGTLGASQLLYDFGKTSGLVGSSREEVLALEAQMQQTISDKIYYVKKIYYDILKTKSIIEVQKKNVSLQKRQLNRARRYLASGIKTIIDVTDAEVRLEQARLDLKNARYQLEIQHARLEAEIGFVPYNGDYVLYARKLPLPHLSSKLPQVRSSLPYFEQYAYEHRYVLESSKHYVQGAKAHVKSLKGDYYPTISVGADYTKQHVDDEVIALMPTDQGKVAVQMNWNLFSGYQTDAQVEEAKVGVLKAATQVQSVKLAVRNQVTESYIAIRRAKENVKLSESIALASQKKLRQAQKRYENELSDFVELQEAQQGYIRSLSDLVNSYYDYFIAMAQLDHAVGR